MPGKNPLTDLLIRKAAPRGAPYRITDHNGERTGLFVQVLPSGKKEFRVRYKTVEGGVKMPLVGVYSSSFGLADARTAARELRQKINAGIDPVLEREQVARQQRADKEAEELRLREEAKQGTVGQLFDLYVSHLKAAGKRSASEVRRAVDKDVIPSLGANTKAKDVEPDHIRGVLTKIVERGNLVYANRVRAYLSAAFNHGIAHDHSPTRLDATQFGVKYNPVTPVPKALKAEPVGERDLSRAEIRQLWKALTTDPSCTFGVATAAKLMLATGLRVQEVVEARWSEIDLQAKRWELPPKRTKKARAHVVPLNAVALSLLERLRVWSGSSAYLFPHHHRKLGDRPMAWRSLNQMVGRLSASKGWEPITARDIRRTVKSRMGEAGISKELRDRLQGHAMQDVSSKHYDRYDYLPEKTAASNEWDAALLRILRGRPL
jgi:integrase